METVFFYNSTEASHNDDHWLPYCTIKSIFWKVSEKAIKVWLKRITVAKRQADNKKQNKYLCRFCCLCRLTENNGQHGCVCGPLNTFMILRRGGGGQSINHCHSKTDLCDWSMECRHHLCRCKNGRQNFPVWLPFPQVFVGQVYQLVHTWVLPNRAAVRNHRAPYSLTGPPFPGRKWLRT